MDKGKAIGLFLTAAIADIPNAAVSFGELYLEGFRPDVSSSDERETSHDIAVILFNLGVDYEDGQDVPKNVMKAASLYTLSAELGDMNALVNLGYLYSENSELKDLAKAIYWYERAISLGDTSAMNNLALVYLYDLNSNEKKVELALDLLQGAVTNGDGWAATTLAMEVEKGTFPELPQSNALELYQFAANQGVARAEYRLALRYIESGANYPKAFLLLERAFDSNYAIEVEDGWESAAMMLAKMYSKGTGTDVDFLKAAEYDAEYASVELINYGQDLAREGKFDSALEAFRLLKNIGKKHGDQNIEISADWYMAYAYSLQNEFRSVLKAVSGRVRDQQFPTQNRVWLYTWYIEAEKELSDFSHFIDIFGQYLRHLREWNIIENDEEAKDSLWEYFRFLSKYDQNLVTAHTFLLDQSQEYDGLLRSYIEEAIGDILTKLNNNRQAYFHFEMSLSHASGDRLVQLIEKVHGAERSAFTFKELEIDESAIDFENLDFWYLSRAYIYDFDMDHPDRTKYLVDRLIEMTSGPFVESDDALKYLIAMEYLAEYHDHADPDSDLVQETYKKAFERFGFNLHSTPLEEITRKKLIEFRELAAWSEDDFDTAILAGKAFIQRDAQIFGSDSPHLLKPLSRLAIYYWVTNQVALYKETVRRAIDIQLKPLLSAGLCSSFYLNWDEAFEVFDRQEIENYLNRSSAAHIASASNYRGLEESYVCRDEVRDLLYFYSLLYETGPVDSASAFKLAQIASLNKFTFSSNLGVSKSLVKDSHLRETINSYNRLSRKLDQALSRGGHISEREDGSSGIDYQQLAKKRAEVENELIVSLPWIARQLTAEPSDIAEISSKLSPNEALVKITRVHDSILVAWIIRSTGHKLISLEADASDLKSKIAVVRSSLSQEEITSVVDIQPYEINTAYEIYSLIWEPLEAYLSDIDRVYVIPTDTLGTIPLEILPTELLSGTIENVIDFGSYGDITWLNDRYQFVYPPSVNSFVDNSSKKIARESKFLGVGNPSPASSTSSGTVVGTFSELIRQGYSSSSPIENLPSLPQSEEQLRILAKIFDSNPTLLLGRDALESNLYELELSNYSTIAFSTHGLLGDKPEDEASLVLSPPQLFTPDADGILTTSEIAQLNLAADLVILSACNTATESQAKGLSSIASSFMHAGATNIIASHWSIEVNATTTLLTSFARKLKNDAGLTRSAALQAARNDVMRKSPSIVASHPIFWGPFTLKGLSETHLNSNRVSKSRGDVN